MQRAIRGLALVVGVVSLIGVTGCDWAGPVADTLGLAFDIVNVWVK